MSHLGLIKISSLLASFHSAIRCMWTSRGEKKIMISLVLDPTHYNTDMLGKVCLLI